MNRHDHQTARPSVRRRSSRAGVLAALVVGTTAAVGTPACRRRRASRPSPPRRTPCRPSVPLADTPPPWLLPADAEPYIEAAGLSVLERGAARSALPRAPRRHRRREEGHRARGHRVRRREREGPGAHRPAHPRHERHPPRRVGQADSRTRSARSFTEWGVALERHADRRSPRRRHQRGAGVRERSTLHRRPRHDPAEASPRDRGSGTARPASSPRSRSRTASPPGCRRGPACSGSAPPTPSSSRISWRRQRTSPLTYAEVGATFDAELPDGYHHVHEHSSSASVTTCGRRACDGIRAWAAHRGAGITVVPADAPIAEGTTVAVVTVTRTRCTCVAACRIVRGRRRARPLRLRVRHVPRAPRGGRGAVRRHPRRTTAWSPSRSSRSPARTTCSPSSADR